MMNANGKNRPDLSPEERAAFLESLAEHVDPFTDHGPIFVQYLNDADPKVRAAAVRGLWHSPAPDLMHQLIEMAQQDPSPLVRARAVSGLGIYIYEGEMADYDFDWGPMNELLREDELPQADFERARDFLLGVYADQARTLDERRFAIEALGFSSDPAIVDLVEEAYNRPEREMKISALFAMGRSGLARWVEILGKELYNSDHDIQREAIRAVGEIGMDELGDDLWRLTFAEERETKLEAILALGQTGWEKGFERLDDLTTDPDPEIAEFAQEALEEWFFMDELLSHADEFDDETEFEDWDLDDLEPDWDQDDSIDS